MAFELDWLEREERYRRRVGRLVVASIVLVAGGLTTVAVLGGRADKARRAAAASAVEAARIAEERRVRAQFVADSTDAAQRVERFIVEYQGEFVPATPIMAVPLPLGKGATAYARELWPTYARIAMPKATDAEVEGAFQQYYVDILNNGPLRGRAALLPAIDQKGKELSLLRPSFVSIAAAQVHVEMREAPATPEGAFGADGAAAASPGGEAPIDAAVADTGAGGDAAGDDSPGDASAAPDTSSAPNP